MPAPNADPIFDSQPVTTATAGQPYSSRSPPTTRTATPWATCWPGPGRDDRRSRDRPGQLAAHRRQPRRRPPSSSRSTTRTAAARRCPSRSRSPAWTCRPSSSRSPARSPARRGSLSRSPRRDRSPGPAAHLLGRQPAAGRRLRHHRRDADWIPAAGQAGTYPDVQFFVSDGVNQVSVATTLLDRARRTSRRPWSRPPTARSSKASRSTSRSRPPTPTATRSASPVPCCRAAPTSTRIPGVFDWTPGYFQHGVYQIPFTVSDGQLSVTQTTTITVLNVNAPPQFDNLARLAGRRGPGRQLPGLRLRPQQPRLRPPGPDRRRHTDAARRDRSDDHLHGQRPARRSDVRPARRRCSTGRRTTPTPATTSSRSPPPTTATARARR